MSHTESAAGPEDGVTRRTSVLRAASAACGLAGAFCALVFVFLIGFSVSGDRLVQTAVELFFPASNADLFYFFGEGYEALGAALHRVPDAPPEYAFFLSLPVAIGTGISVASLAGTAVFSLLALIRAIRFFCKKTQEAPEFFAAAAWGFYLAGTAALRALVGCSADLSAEFAGIRLLSLHAEFFPNNATKTGIALSTAFVAAALFLYALPKLRALFRPPRPADAVLFFAQTAVAAALFCFLPSSLFAIRADELPVTDRLIGSARAETGFFTLSNLLASAMLEQGASSAELAACAGFAAASFFLRLACTAFASALLVVLLHAPFGRRAAEGWLAVGALVCALCSFLSLLFALREALDAAVPDGTLSGFPLTSALLVAFAAAECALSLVSVLLGRKRHPRAAVSEETAR